MKLFSLFFLTIAFLITHAEPLATETRVLTEEAGNVRKTSKYTKDNKYNVTTYTLTTNRGSISITRKKSSTDENSTEEYTSDLPGKLQSNKALFDMVRIKFITAKYSKEITLKNRGGVTHAICNPAAVQMCSN